MVDREEELAAGLALLRGGAARLLTLLGPGGSGKTRLAVALAEALGAESTAAFFVDLAHVADPHQVLRQVAATLRLRDVPGEPLAETLVRAIGARRLLLLLDNLEQVVGAGAEIAALLAACPNLRVIATSRQPLRVRWEHVLPVPPLPLPAADAGVTADELLACPATRLFVERARAVNPRFELGGEALGAIAEICRRLDGLPLAIEIAAARADLLAPEAMLARVGGALDLAEEGPADLPARQRSLRSTIGWSYALLDDAEQAAFRCLAVFPGGCTAGGAAAVLSDADDRTPALARLSSLADKSLLVVDGGPSGPRFRMLETVREYALERLAERGEADDARARQAAFVAGVADEASAGLLGPNQAGWLERLDAEQANVRAALDWARASGDAATGLRAAGGLWRYWELRGRLREGREALAALLALPHGDDESAGRIGALHAAAHLAFLEADYAAARPLYEQCRDAARRAGDTGVEAAAANGLGLVETCLSRFVDACEHFGRAFALNRARGDRAAMAANLNNFGRVALYQGDPAQAFRFHEESLGVRREIGDLWGQGIALSDLAEAVLGLDDPAAARRLQLESLDVWRALGSGWGVAYVLEGLVGVELAEARPERAARLAGAAAALRERLGEPTSPVRAAGLARQIDAARLALGPSRFEAAWAEGQALEIDQAVALARESAVRAGLTAGADAASPSADPLSAREREVAAHVARGLTNRQIADELVISERTVDVHVARILSKLGFSTRAQVAAWIARREAQPA